MERHGRPFIRLVLVALLACITVAAAAPPASAGMVVAIVMDRLGVTGQDTDVTLIDPFTPSGILGVPPGVNSSFDTKAAALSGDGRRLVVNAAGNFMIAVDRATGRHEGESLGMEDPPGDTTCVECGFAITPDGRRLVAARVFRGSRHQNQASVSAFLLDPFPGGPFAPAGRLTVTDGRLDHERPTPNGAAFAMEPSITNGGRVAWAAFGPAGSLLVLGTLGGSASVMHNPGVSDTALRPGDPGRVTVVASGDLKTVKFDGSPTLETLALPNTSLSGDEAFPNWTADSRYLVWLDLGPPVQVPSGDTLREGTIKVYDMATQQLVATRALGRKKRFFSLAVGQTPHSLITGLSIPDPTFEIDEDALSLNASLTLRTTVGILVQRIVGTRRLLGRRVPRLAPVGRVPLGSRARGRNRIPWNGRVNGRRLSPGLYQITLRALRGRRITDLSRPVRLRVTG